MSFLVIVLVIAPGIGATLAVFKAGQARLPTMLACAVGLGQVVVAAWAFLLVLLRLLNPLTFFSGVALLTSALWIAGLRRSAFSQRAKAIAEELRTDGVPTALGLITVVVVAVALLQGQSGLQNFGLANPFRYWADALEVADAGRVPSESLQWGSLYPPTVSKLAFNAFNGAFSYLSDDPLQLMKSLLMMVLVGSTFAGWALGRELGLRFLAPLLSILPASEPFTRSLVISPQRWYAAETFARLALVTGLILALNALHRRSAGVVAIAAGTALGIAALTHLVAAGVGIGLLCLYCLFFVVLKRDEVKHVGRLAAVIGAVFVTLVLSGLFLSGGDAAFNTVDRDQAIDTRGGVFDPTYYFASGRVEQSPEVQPRARAEMNDGWYRLPGELFEGFVSHTISVEVEGVTAYAVFLGIGALAVGLSFLARGRIRPVPMAAFAGWTGILVVTLAMSYMYETYVPAVFPQRRMWSYDTFMLVLVGVAAAEVAIQRLAKVREWVAVAVAGVVLLGATVSSLPPEPDRTRQIQGADSLRAMNWVARNLPCDARILANQRTGGTFQAVVGRVAVTEGMAPYLRPAMLRDVTDMLLEFRSFFQSPQDNEETLTDYGVSHVVVAKKQYLLDERPALLGRLRPRLMEEVGALEKVYESDSMDVYRVPETDTSGWPQPDGHAGYNCRTRPLSIPTVHEAD